MIAMQFKKFLLTVVLMVISLLLIMFSVMIYKGKQYSYISCDDILSKGIEGTAILRLDEDSFLNVKGVKAFFKEAYERKEIYSVGNMVEYGCYYESLEELYEIQKGHTQDYELALQGGLLEINCMNLGAAFLCDLKLEEGISPKKLEFDESEKMFYLYIGAAYDSVEVGSEFIEKNGTKFIVAGRMEEQQRWVDSNVENGYNSERLDCSVDCSYGIFMVGNYDVYSGGLWISAEDGYTIEQAIDAAKEVGDKYDISFSYETLANMYEQDEEDVDLLLSYLAKLLGIVIAASLLMIITTQIVTMLENAKAYGVMYVVGFSPKEVNKMLLWKHIITAVSSLVLTAPLCVLVAKYRFSTDDMSYMIKTLLIHYVFPIAITVEIVIVVIMQMITVTVLRRFTPVKLIQNKVV